MLTHLEVGLPVGAERGAPLQQRPLLGHDGPDRNRGIGRHVRNDRIGQPLRAIHQHGVDGSGQAGSEPAFVHQPKRHRRSDERQQPKFADPDILKSDRDKDPREIASEAQCGA